MYRRHALTAIALGLLLTSAAAETITVPTDHDTINAAIANAANNDTIVIKKGTYREAVLLENLDGMTIKAKGKVVIEPPSANDPAFTARNCDGLTIQGLRTQNAGDGFVIDGCDDVTLTKFSVTSVARHGVFAFGSSDVTVSKGKIVDCGVDGVSFADELPGAPVNGGLISKVKIADCGEDGVDVLGSDITVSKCTVKDVDDDGFESDDSGTGGIRFEKCRAQACDDEGFELGTPGTVCIKCSARSVDCDGFDIEADNCELEKCTSIGSGEAGFAIDDIDAADLNKCKSVKSRLSGFAFYDATNATLLKCTSTRALGDGFFLDSGTQDCVLTQCKGTRSKDFDLDDESDGSNTFPRSKFKTIDD